MRRPFSPRAPLLATPTFCTAFGAKCAQCVQHCGRIISRLLRREGFPAWRQIMGFLPARVAWGGKRCTGAFALFGCHCAFRAAKQPQQLASITFCLPQPSVAKQGVSEGELRPSQTSRCSPSGFSYFAKSKGIQGDYLTMNPSSSHKSCQSFAPSHKNTCPLTSRFPFSRVAIFAISSSVSGSSVTHFRLLA